VFGLGARLLRIGRFLGQRAMRSNTPATAAPSSAS
jgi:hypothetical protein